MAYFIIGGFTIMLLIGIIQWVEEAVKRWKNIFTG